MDNKLYHNKSNMATVTKWRIILWVQPPRRMGKKSVKVTCTTQCNMVALQSWFKLMRTFRRLRYYFVQEITVAFFSDRLLLTGLFVLLCSDDANM